MRRQRHGADRAHGAALGRRGEAEQDRAQDEEDQHQRGHHAPEAFAGERPALEGAGLRRQSRHGGGAEDAEDEDVGAEQQHLDDAGADGAGIHVAHRAAELVAQHDQHQGGRDQLGDGARGGDHARGHPLVVVVADHDGQAEQPHGDDRGGHGAGDGAEQGAHQDHGIGEPAAHRAEELARPFQQILRQAAALQYGAHEGEEGDGQQQVVGHDAEDALRQGLEQGHGEIAMLDGDGREEQADGGQREGHGKADQQEDDEAPEHHGGHHVEADHCSGFSYSATMPW